MARRLPPARLPLPRRPAQGAAVAPVNPWLRAADIVAPKAPVNEWYLPNPDPSVTDPARLYRDAETGLLLVRGRARPKQRPPEGDWFVWLMLTGRGFGKTKSAGEWIDDCARGMSAGDQILIAGRTPSDLKDYSLHGPGGLLTNHPDITLQLTNRLLLWPNGVRGLIRSGANPEEFRGFSGSLAWLDEFAAWDYPTLCWENLILGMRESSPRIVISTTPRPLAVLKQIAAASSTVVVRGTSYENRANLADRFVAEVLDARQGTRLGRQEIDGEILEDLEGALWKLATIESTRVTKDDVPPFVRVATGVDPQGAKIEGSETGIVTAGLAADGSIYVLEDGSLNGSPEEWGLRALALHERHCGDILAAEKNFGGDMVASNLRAVQQNAPVALVNASRGKIPRAEPVATLYGQGKVHHVGAFPALEDEMCSYTRATARSPNRMDALVWAVTVLAFPDEQVQAPPKVYGTWGTRRIQG